MLYIVYLPKKEKEKIKDRKVNKMLEIYSKVTNYQNSIIASPGYMSKTAATISNYLKNLSNIVTNGRIYYGIFNGMNGNHNCQGVSILDRHQQEMKKYNFININIDSKVNKDHRKVMCFFTLNNNIYKEINFKNYDDFLNEINVNAVLIGSSNQSDSTYFKAVADKGEADIFMFSGEWFDNQGKKKTITDENVISNDYIGSDEITITKSWQGKAHTKTNEFLKEILKDLLETNLK